jgi:hypothetical protein
VCCIGALSQEQKRLVFMICLDPPLKPWCPGQIYIQDIIQSSFLTYCHLTDDINTLLCDSPSMLNDLVWNGNRNTFGWWIIGGGILSQCWVFCSSYPPFIDWTFLTKCWIFSHVVVMSTQYCLWVCLSSELTLKSSIINLPTCTVPSESIQTPWLFPHFVRLQPYSKMD